MAEVNFAELQHKMDTDPTPAMCERAGGTHRAYCWAGIVCDWWSQECKDAYNKGYDEMGVAMGGSYNPNC